MTTALLRTIILYFVLVLGLRLTGKRQIGELEPSELVLTLIISDLAAVPMQDYGIPLVNGLIPIATLLCLSTLLSYWNLKSIRFRSLLCGRPAILVQDGAICQSVMARNRFTLDELFEQLRGQGISDLAQVKYAILETSGKLSVLPRGSGGQPDPTLPLPIISDGRLLLHNLRDSGFSYEWLTKQLKKHGFTDPTQVFFLSVDNQGSVLCIGKEGEQ